MVRFTEWERERFINLDDWWFQCKKCGYKTTKKGMPSHKCKSKE